MNESAVTSITSTRRAWMSLLRPPNLPTVPGDPLAGAALALAAGGSTPYASSLAAVVTAAVLLYAAGLIQNDCFDRDEDRRERPERPIPSGQVRPRQALLVWIALGAAGLGAALLAGRAAGGMASLLLGVITLYNATHRRFPFAAPLLMGACRGASLLMGAAAVMPLRSTPQNVIVATLMLSLLIASITSIAANETMTSPVGIRRFAPAAAVLLGMFALGPYAFVHGSVWTRTVAIAFALAAIGWQVHCGRLLRPRAKREIGNKGSYAACSLPAVPPVIGRMIRGLLLVQATLVACHHRGLLPAAALLLLWPLSRRLARSYYAS